MCSEKQFMLAKAQVASIYFFRESCTSDGKSPPWVLTQPETAQKTAIPQPKNYPKLPFATAQSCHCPPVRHIHMVCSPPSPGTLGNLAPVCIQCSAQAEQEQEWEGEEIASKLLKAVALPREV